MELSGDIISSRQNRTVVEICKLSDRKARDAGRVFRFDGIKLCEEAIRKGVELQTVLLRASSAERVRAELLRRCNVDLAEISAREDIFTPPIPMKNRCLHPSSIDWIISGP